VADQFVQVANDGTGKKVDTSELTVGTNTVERQRTVIADDSNSAGLAKVTNQAPNVTDTGLVVRNIEEPNNDEELLSSILTELRVISFILAAGLGVKEDVEELRDAFDE
jgi:hypothetical protein